MSKFCKEVKLVVPTTSFKGEVDYSDLEKKDNVYYLLEASFKRDTGQEEG